VQFALVGLAVFSALAALAGTFPVLVVARALQAVCAAALGPGAQSLLRSVSSPAEHGRVFGIFGSMMGAGAAAGPVVGGVLVQLFDWRAIFFVNVPIALAALAATRARATARSTTARPGPTRDGAGPVASTEAERVFNPVFVAGFSAQALTTQAQYALLLLTPIVLDVRGWSAGSIGLVLAALTFGMIVMAPIGGRLGDRRGRRYPSAVGISFAAASIAVLAIAGPSVVPLMLVGVLVAFGVGLGAATPNLMSAALGSVPEARTGAAAGVFTTSRYVGSIATSLLIGALVADDATGTRSVLLTSVACMALAVLVTRWLPTVPTEEARDVDGARHASA
jgi:MFS family permease